MGTYFSAFLLRLFFFLSKPWLPFLSLFFLPFLQEHSLCAIPIIGYLPFRRTMIGDLQRQDAPGLSAARRTEARIARLPASDAARHAPMALGYQLHAGRLPEALLHSPTGSLPADGGR